MSVAGRLLGERESSDGEARVTCRGHRADVYWKAKHTAGTHGEGANELAAALLEAQRHGPYARC